MPPSPPASATAKAGAASPPAWHFPLGLLAIALGMPALFWFRFGWVDSYALGFTGFLLLLAVGVHVIVPAVDRLGPSSRAAEIRPGPFDFLGVIWLLLIPLAPFASWLLLSMVTPTRHNWYNLSMAQMLLCVVAPLVCVLPLIPYVRGKPALFMSLVLVAGTGFPMLFGLSATYDVIEGPQWEQVQVTELRGVHFRSGSSTVRESEVFVMLADGRRLTHAPGLALRTGPAKLLILRGYRHVLAVGPN